jgi:hypothetical protein
MFEYLNYVQIPIDLRDHILDLAFKNSSYQAERFEKFYIDNRIEEAIDESYPTVKLGLGISPKEAEKVSGMCTMTMFQSDKVTDWVRNNINDSFMAVHIQNFDRGSLFFPHVDLIRTKALNYLIESGDADTIFFEPLEEFKNLVPQPSTYIPHNRIREIKKIKIETNRWHQLDVTKIHNVENIKSRRLAITVSFA